MTLRFDMKSLWPHDFGRARLWSPLLLMLTFSTLISTLVLAEEVDPSKLNPIEISAIETQPKNTKPGEPVELRIQLKIAPGFHAYVEQYRLALKQPENLRLSGLQVQPTIRFDDPISHRERLGTENHAEIISLIDTTAATGGRQNLELELTYQACGKDFCLFPKKIPLKYEMRLAGGSEDVFLQALNKGWLYALLIVFFAGFLTSLTPCIFPMIPITLAILGATDHSHSRRRAFTLSVFYVLGIATTYSSLGVMAAKTGSLFGAVLGSPLVIGFVAILFILMGLSMYGLFEIQIPHFITHRLTQRHSHGHGQSRPTGYFRAYSSGLVAGIVASPCVGPVLISVLAYVAQTQNVLLGFLLLFTFALGLGQLFLVIGTYHNMWQKLPRSGPWLEQVKFLFGTIMIAMAFYYIHPVTHGPLFDGLLATGLLIFTVYFGAFRPRRQLHTKWQRSGQALLRVIFVFALILAAKAMAPTRLMNQIMGATNTPTENKNVASPDWYRFSDELLKHAQSQGRPVILDFKADWCLSCKELDVKTFTDPRVLELGKKFVWLEVDATSSSPELETLRARYQIGGLPFVALFDSHGQWHKEWTLTGFESADLFLKRMQEALAF